MEAGHKPWAGRIKVATGTKSIFNKGKKKMNKMSLPSWAATAALFFAPFAVGALPLNGADGPTDPQIVGIVVAANQIDIDYGKLALSKSRNKQVREFAQRMVTDHSAVQKSVFELAGKLGVKGEDSAISIGLKTAARETTAKLQSLKGKEFDKFYLDNEAAYHKAVTDAVESVLIPNAQNAELKSALVGAQPLFLKHLEHARHAQMGGAMGKVSGGAMGLAGGHE